MAEKKAEITNDILQAKILKVEEKAEKAIEDIKAEIEALKSKLAEVDKLANDLLASIRMG